VGFIAALADAKLALGQAFLPILNIVLPILTRLARAAEVAFARVAQLMRALFPKSNIKAGAQQTAIIESQTGAVNSLEDAHNAAGKAAKKAAGQLQGFDEVNNISSSSGEGDATPAKPAAGSGGVSLGSMDEIDSATTDISPKIQAIADKIRAAFFYMRDGIKLAFGEISSLIVQHKDIIIAALAGLAAGIATYFVATNWVAAVAAIKAALVGLRVAIIATWTAISWPIVLVVGLIAAAVAAFVYFYRTNEGFKGVVDGILQKIGDTAKWLWKDVIVPFSSWLAESFVDSWNRVTAVATWFWKNVLVPLGAFVKQFYSAVIIPLATILRDVLGVAFTFVANIATSFWKNVLVPLGNFFKDVFGPAVEALSAVFNFFWKYAIKPLAEYLGGVFLNVWNKVVDVIQFLWDMMKPFATYVSNVFAAEFDGAFRIMGDNINRLKNFFISLSNYITQVFTGDWENSWEAIKGVFSNVFSSFYDIAKEPLNRVIDMINKVIDGFNKITSFEIAGQEIGLGIKIPRIPKLARGGITQGRTNMGNYVAGEAGAEMIVPLENTSFTDKIAAALGSAVMTAMQMGQGQGKGDVVVQVSGVELARVMQPYTNSENKRLGGSMIAAT
jgi:hypothetical protein